MDFQELVKYRRSSRWLFSKKPIPDGDLRKILEAARYAPTPHNTQPFEIIVVNDREKKMLGYIHKLFPILNGK